MSQLSKEQINGASTILHQLMEDDNNLTQQLIDHMFEALRRESNGENFDDEDLKSLSVEMFKDINDEIDNNILTYFEDTDQSGYHLAYHKIKEALEEFHDQELPYQILVTRLITIFQVTCETTEEWHQMCEFVYKNAYEYAQGQTGVFSLTSSQSILYGLEK